MPYFEQITPRGLNKDVSPRAIDKGGNRLAVNPLIHALNARYITSKADDMGLFHNIPGTVLHDYSLPEGNNLTIGTFVDVENTVLIFFNWNSNNQHGIYSWDPLSNVFTTIIISPILNFSNHPKHRITGIGMVAGMLYFTDNLNPQRMINSRRIYIGLQTSEEISLFKKAPTRTPYISQYNRSLGGPVTVNYVRKNNYQFATQYVFIDNEVSAISDYSNISPASIDGDESSPFSNNVNVIHPYDTELINCLKQVRCLFRKSETDPWKIYVTKDRSFLVPNGSIDAQLFDNISYDTLDVTQAAKVYDTIPNKSKALASFKNRNFLVADIDGYNVDFIGELTPVISTEPYSEQVTLRKLYMKEGGSYSIGIEYFDTYMRSMGVFNPVNVIAPYKAPSDVLSVTETEKQKLSVNIAGGPPSWAKYYRIVRTKEQTYETYMQFTVKVLYYIAEKADNAVPSNAEEFLNGKIYLKNRPNSAGLFNQIHLQIPDAIPFAPDGTYFVRMISAIGVQRTAKVILYDGQIIACDNFGMSNWSNVPQRVLVEVFKYKKEKDRLYYGASDIYDIANGLHSVTNVPVRMDTTTISFSNYGLDLRLKFSNISKSSTLIGDTYDPTIVSSGPWVESPATSTIKSATATGLVKKLNPTGGTDSYSTSTLDYSKILNNLGRQSLLANNPVELKRTTTIKFSDPFIQDSSVNGLSSFLALNEYALPHNRTPITKLQQADQVLLAIHQRNITSLYVGEGVIQDSRGNTTITKTDEVIGQDRVLDGGYGSYHPESIAEVDGMVFGFDIFKGVIWRYTPAGVFPISSIRMSTYFREKAAQYVNLKDQVAIIGGIDVANKEYLITFPAINSIPAETWAFNYKEEEWTCQYSFTPEAYANINTQLVSFVNGKLWVHNSDLNNYNTFYGIKYPRQLRFSLNPAPTKVKNWMALQVSAENLGQGDEAMIIFARCYDKEGQETYMRIQHFDKEEGIYYGPILKDLHSVVPAGQIAIQDGNDMRSQVLDIVLEHNGKDAGKFSYANVVFVMSEYSH